VSNRLTIVAVLLTLALAAPVQAVFTKVGMAGMPFLKIGVGRSTGMGEAFVAVADDASAAYWNPAGLALVGQRQALVNHIDWICDVNHEYVVGVMPTSAGSIGVAVTALNQGTFEETTIDEPQGTGVTFSARDLALGISYARLFTDKLAFGLSAKVVSEQVWSVAASGLAFDFGVHYSTGWQNLRLGMAIANFGPDLRYGGGLLNFTHDPGYEWPWTREQLPGSYLTETFPLPVTFRFGLAYDLFRRDASYMTAALDLNHFNDVNEKVNLGLEYCLKPIWLRVGYIVNADAEYARAIGWGTGLSAGLGVRVRPAEAIGLGLDYGYRNLGRLGMSHRLTVAVEL
jgi:hypothetical protein